jgi:hypothetical protein
MFLVMSMRRLCVMVSRTPLHFPSGLAGANAAFVGFRDFDKLAAMREQSVLQIDG